EGVDRQCTSNSGHYFLPSFLVSQTIAVVSFRPIARSLPSGERDIAWVRPAPCNSPLCFPVLMSQNRIVSSMPVETRILVLGTNPSQSTGLSCPTSLRRSFPVATSQRPIVLSSFLPSSSISFGNKKPPPDAKLLPSGANATDVIQIR